MLNKFTKTTIFLEVIVCVLVTLTFFDFEFANIDPDEQFIFASILLLVLSLIFSIVGAYKEYHKDITISRRKTSLIVVFSVPILAAAAIFGILATFYY